MLRTFVFALAIAAPGLAMAEPNQRQFPDSAVGVEVRGDDGTVVGHVDHVVRDSHGRISSAEVAGLEPGSAPYASSDLVADRNDPNRLFVVDRRADQRRVTSEATRTR